MGIDVQISEYSEIENKLTANGVNIGEISVINNQLLWHTGVQTSYQVKFSLKDTERLRKILDKLIEYQKQNGYEDLLIRNCRGDIGTFFSKEDWDALGFELSEVGTYYRRKENEKK